MADSIVVVPVSSTIRISWFDAFKDLHRTRTDAFVAGRILQNAVPLLPCFLCVNVPSFRCLRRFAVHS